MAAGPSLYNQSPMRRRGIRLFVLVLVLAAVCAACGGGATPSRDLRVGSEVSFDVPTAPGAATTLRLRAIERGRGMVGVVLAHMLGSGQSAWSAVAGDLAGRGYHVLTFDFRGHGLSGGSRDPSRADLDLAGAIAELRSLGATSLFAVGASMGGTAAIKVGSIERLNGVVSISGPAKIDALDVSDAVRHLLESSLFIAGEQDGRYTEDARTLYGNAPQPKKLEIISGSSAHGTDLLTGTTKPRVEAMILDFLAAHRGS